MSIPRFQNVPEINKSGMTFENYLRQIRLLKYSLPDMYDKYFYMIHNFYLEEFSKIEAGKAFQDENGDKSQYDDLIYSLLDLFTSNFVENSFLLYEKEDSPNDYMNRITSVLGVITTNIKNGIKQADLPDWAIKYFINYFVTHSDFFENISDNYPIDNTDFKLQKELAMSDIEKTYSLIRLGMKESIKTDIPAHITDYLDLLMYYTSEIDKLYREGIIQQIKSGIYTNISKLNSYLNSSNYELNRKIKYANVREYVVNEYNKQKDIVDFLSQYLYDLYNYDYHTYDLLAKLVSFTGANYSISYNINRIYKKSLNPFVNSIDFLQMHYQKGYNNGNTDPNDPQTTFYKVFAEIMKDPRFSIIPTSDYEQDYNNKLLEKMGAMLLANYMFVNTGDTPSINEVDDPYKYLAQQGNFVSRLQKSGYTIVPYTTPTT